MDWTPFELENYRSYHCPKGALHRRAEGIVHCNDSETENHRKMKKFICERLRKQGHKFVTEAIRNAKDHNGVFRRVDVVDLTTGEEWEIETTLKRAKRFLDDPGFDNIHVVSAGWSEKDLDTWKKLLEAR